MGELALVAAESGCVMVSTAVDDLCWVIDVEHFVEDDVFHDELRDGWRVERLADDDRLVRRVVVAEDAVGLSG